MKRIIPFLLQGINLFITAFLGFIFLPLISNYLTASEVGLYAQLLSILSLGLLIVGTGTTNYNYRFLNNGDFKNLINSFFIFLLFQLISILIILIYIHFINKFNTVDLFIIIGVLVIFSFYKFLHSIIYANERHKEYVILNLFEALIRYVFALFLVFFGYQYISYFIGNLVSSIFVSILAIYFVKKLFLLKNEENSRKTVGINSIPYTIKYISLYSISGISIWFLTSIDILLVGKFLGDEQAGIYSLGYTLGFQIITFILMVINNVIEPRLLSKDKVQLENYQVVNRIFVYISIPIILFIYFNVEFYYKFFIDSSFSESSTITILILMSSLFWGIYKLCSIKFARDLKPATYTKLVLIASIINIILNLILINELGIIGAAIASIIAYLFLAISGLVYIYKIKDLLIYIGKSSITFILLFMCMIIIDEVFYSPWITQVAHLFIIFIFYIILIITRGRFLGKKGYFGR